MMSPSCRFRAAAQGLVAGLMLTLAGPTVAAPVGELQAEVADLEKKAGTLRIDAGMKQVSESRQAESRLVDAQVLYTLKDYTRAAILLLDYVNKYKTERGYPEALFFLADALYQNRNFLSAKKYFREIVNVARGRYYQEALQRLVELSLRMGETGQIGEYLNALAAVPPAQLKPSVPYVVAKYHYFRGDVDRAIQGFRQIPSNSKYYVHAQYFIGVAMVRKKDYSGAAKVFQGVLRLPTKTTSQKHVQDLAYMGLGRLFYEKGKIAEAIGAYEKVPRTSPEFDTALYEIAWAYVKQKSFPKALRALELLDLANPNSPFIPEVKVLQGNLLIRLKKWSLATDLFSRSRERFMPVYTRMNQVMTEHADPNVFFDLLLARNMVKFGVKIQVPALAIHWVKERKGIKRALNLVEDVRGIKDDIDEASKLIKKLEVAVNSPAKIKVFPEFAEAKASSLEVENRLTMTRLRILYEERKRVVQMASGSQKDELQTISDLRVSLEQKIKNLPKTAEDYEGREKDEQGKLAKMEQELNRLSIMVESLRAQLVAAEKYFEDTSTQRDKQTRETFRKEIGGVKSVVDGLQKEVDTLQQAVAAAKSATGVGGPSEVAERKTKAKLKRLVKREQKILEELRTQISGPKAAEFDALSALMGRCEQVDSTLSAFDSRLNQSVEQKLSGIRTILNAEKANVGQYDQQLITYKSETDRAAGNLTYAGFHAVAKKFKEIVVRADVGIIDVAWALKDAKSKEVSRLVRQRNADLKMLDDEFREVLRED